MKVFPGGEDVEILIVDDGSKDETPAIADEYEAKYPGIIRAIHQENGGHGEAVNAGLRNATGFFYKVVDSDDWVNRSLPEDTCLLKEAVKEEEPLDMLLSNYVYEKVGAKHKRLSSIILFCRRIVTLDEEDWTFPCQPEYFDAFGDLPYRAASSFQFELPKHTFYVDNIFVYWPLPYVKKMYYLDVDFYRYFIGRDDQSVNEKVMISRIDQQIRVNKIMIDLYAKHESMLSCPQLKEYMLHYLETIQMVTSVLLMKMNTSESEAMRDDLWHYLEEKSPDAYKILKSSVLGKFTKSHNKLSHKLTMGGYKIAQKWIGFN